MINNFRNEYSWLSNFYDSPVVIDGLTYRNAESAYQAMKCADPNNRQRFIDLTGAQAKRLGRTLRMDPAWEIKKFGVMYKVVEDKFLRNTMLMRWLQETGDEELVEGNTWNDTYWGVCGGKGTNYLGVILMTIRRKYGIRVDF